MCKHLGNNFGSSLYRFQTHQIQTNILKTTIDLWTKDSNTLWLSDLEKKKMKTRLLIDI